MKNPRSPSNQVLAILCADLHFSHNSPSCRDIGKNQEESKRLWYGTMSRYLKQLHQLARKYASPIVIAGDIFDSWREPAELVNFVIRAIPPDVQWYGIPGNHDTPNHDLSQLRRSCYWTLVEAGKLINLEHDHPIELPGTQPVRLWGFPHGNPVTPLENPHDLLVEVAVVHQYVWTRGTGYQGAPEKYRLRTFLKKVSGYDVVLVGDNHQGFLSGKVFNAGALIRGTAKEKDYQPQVGLLYQDGTITRHPLDCSKDKFTEDQAIVKGKDVNFGSFVKELKRLGKQGLDFKTAVDRWLRKHKVSKETRQEIQGALE